MALRLSGDGSLNLSDVTLDNVTASGLSASGTVSLPPTTSIGDVSDTEIAFVDGVTSSVQTQLNTLDGALGSKLDLAGGKILQIVQDTDTTQRATSSTSFTDVTGMSVTITPQKSDSTILLMLAVIMGAFANTNAATEGYLQISDSSNNAIAGAQESQIYGGGGGNTSFAIYSPVTLIAYSTPATTSAVTYKARFKSVSGSTVVLRNNLSTGSLYAIEVSA